MYDNVNEMLGRCHAERMARLQTTQRTMEVHGHGVVICERVGESIGATMWPEGALPMMEAMWTWERWAPDIGLPMNPRKIVELGAGCGVCGIFAKKIWPGADVVLTDLPAQTPLLEHNVDVNKCGDGIAVCAYEWGADEVPKKLRQQCDLVVASECVYDPLLSEKLLTSLRALDAPVLMSFGRTREAEVDFWLAVEKLKPGAVVRELGEKTKLLDLRRCVSGAL
eukprot:GEMP01067503.1.p1 GENE.GEMP01067503.1~~GEMP01067503.1.p1  ORF type:complete len:224 (+),score=65.35 GEMP01067503.1:149-820(+)